MSDEIKIANLLYTYCEFMDAGRFEDVARLFEHAKIKVGNSGGEPTITDWRGVLDTWNSMVQTYPDGTPRTKHLVLNPIIEVDASGKSAETRSYYLVLQATEGFPLQPVAAGRYHDRFEKVDGKWRWGYRDYSMFDMQGDLSRHLIGYA